MDKTGLLLHVLVSGICILILMLRMRYRRKFYRELQYVKENIHCAQNWTEYVYWKRELCILRWCMIPGFTPKRIIAVQYLFQRDKRVCKITKQDDGFMSYFLPSLMGICLCAVCLVGSTFALFSVTQDVSTQKIVAAEYKVIPVISDGKNTLDADANGLFSLKGNTTYTITLNALGTATTGYGVLIFDGNEYHHTQQLSANETENQKTITFSLEMNQDATLKIESQWGTSAWDNKFVHGETYSYGIKQEENTDHSSEQTENIETPEMDEEGVVEGEGTEGETSEEEVSGAELSEVENSEGENSEEENVEGETSEEEVSGGELPEEEIPESEKVEEEALEGETEEAETLEGETSESEISDEETLEGEVPTEEISEEETPEEETILEEMIEAENLEGESLEEASVGGEISEQGVVEEEISEQEVIEEPTEEETAMNEVAEVVIVEEVVEEEIIETETMVESNAG